MAKHLEWLGAESEQQQLVSSESSNAFGQDRLICSFPYILFFDLRPHFEMLFIFHSTWSISRTSFFYLFLLVWKKKKNYEKCIEFQSGWDNIVYQEFQFIDPTSKSLNYRIGIKLTSNNSTLWVKHSVLLVLCILVLPNPEILLKSSQNHRIE